LYLKEKEGGGGEKKDEEDDGEDDEEVHEEAGDDADDADLSVDRESANQEKTQSEKGSGKGKNKIKDKQTNKPKYLTGKETNKKLTVGPGEGVHDVGEGAHGRLQLLRAVSEVALAVLGPVGEVVGKEEAILVGAALLRSAGHSRKGEEKGNNGLHLRPRGGRIEGNENLRTRGVCVFLFFSFFFLFAHEERERSSTRAR
jgi:hypothetical protein